MTKYPFLAALIAGGEGGLNSINRGSVGTFSVTRKERESGLNAARKYIGTDLTNLTLRQIRGMQKPTDSEKKKAGSYSKAADKKPGFINKQTGKKDFLFGVGRFQFTPNTLETAIEKTGISLDTLFDQNTQDRLFDYLIEVKKPIIGRYVNCKSKNKIAAQIAMAQEFASVADPRTGITYYPTTGNNAANITVADASTALDQERAVGCNGNRKLSNYVVNTGGGGSGNGRGGRLQRVDLPDNRDFDESQRVEEEVPVNPTIELEPGTIDEYDRESESSIFESTQGTQEQKSSSLNIGPENTSRQESPTIGNKRSLSILETNDTQFLGQDPKEKTPASSEGSEKAEDASLAKEQEKKTNNNKEPLNINGKDKVLFSTWVYDPKNKTDVGGIEFRGNLSYHYSATNTILYS